MGERERGREGERGEQSKFTYANGSERRAEHCVSKVGSEGLLLSKMFGVRDISLTSGTICESLATSEQFIFNEKQKIVYLHST